MNVSMVKEMKSINSLNLAPTTCAGEDKEAKKANWLEKQHKRAADTIEAAHEAWKSKSQEDKEAKKATQAEEAKAEEE